MKSVSTLLVLLLCAGFGEAQQQRKLTLEDAVELARQKNLAVIQARNNVEGRQSAVTAAYGSLLPTLDASASYRSNTSWVTPFDGVTSKSYDAGLSGRIILFDGFANFSNISRSKSDASAAEYDVNRVEQTAIYQTHQLFLNVVRTAQLSNVAEDNLKRSQRQLERISESNKVGAVALADVYRQRVQVGSDELLLIQAQNNHEKSKQDCLAYIGVDFDSEYVFEFSEGTTTVDTLEFASVNATYGNFNELVRTALTRRPDYRASADIVDGTDASVTIARSGHLPTVSATGSYGYSGFENAAGTSSLSDNRDLSVGVAVSLPIFSGFATQSRISQAVVQQRNAQQQLRQSERQVTVDVRKALLDLEAAEKQVRVTASSVVSAGIDRKIAEEKYALGASTLLDLLIANANYTTALSNKVNAVIGYQLSKKGAEYALGTISK